MFEVDKYSENKIYGLHLFGSFNLMDDLVEAVSQYHDDLLEKKKVNLGSSENKKISDMYVKKIFSNLHKYNKHNDFIIKKLPDKYTLKKWDNYNAKHDLDAEIVNRNLKQLTKSNSISKQIYLAKSIHVAAQNIVSSVERLCDGLCKNVTYPEINLTADDIEEHIREKYDTDKYKIKKYSSQYGWNNKVTIRKK